MKMDSRLRKSHGILMDAYLEITPKDGVPQITMKYPESYQESKLIPKFSFPCSLDEQYLQYYSFVMTSVDSKYTFGFCRFDPNMGVSLVIMSHLPWHDFFYKLLSRITPIANIPECREHLKTFLNQCIGHSIFGSAIELTIITRTGNVTKEVNFVCDYPDNELPSVPRNSNLTEYVCSLHPKGMIQFWAAMLFERRIIVVATKLSRVSATVQAANETLYPMSWQHIYIPIVPRDLVDCLYAPMPYLVGVPAEVMQDVRLSDIGDVVIVDLDNKRVVSPYNDEASLPAKVVYNLKEAWCIGNVKRDSVSRAFIQAFVEMIGGYHKALRPDNDKVITFDPEVFVKSRRNLQPLLRRIVDSQMFREFIDERVAVLNAGGKLDDDDEFERECVIYLESRGGADSLQKQFKLWASAVKESLHFRNIRDKMGNQGVRSAVKLVRKRGKGLKTFMGQFMHKSGPAAWDLLPPTSSTRLETRSSDASTASSCSSTNVAEPRHLSLDLLKEMESLYPEQNAKHGSNFFTDTPKKSSIASTSNDNTTQNVPIVPARPNLPSKYPIVAIRNLVDLSNAPALPPRTPVNPNEAAVHKQSKQYGFRNSLDTSSIRPELRQLREIKPQLSSASSAFDVKYSSTANGNALSVYPMHLDNTRMPLMPMQCYPKGTSKVREVSDSEQDLIQLNTTDDIKDSSPTLEDFDPLKASGSKKDNVLVAKGSSDSALLHEYGLDFSQFEKWNFPHNSKEN